MNNAGKLSLCNCTHESDAYNSLQSCNDTMSDEPLKLDIPDLLLKKLYPLDKKVGNKKPAHCNLCNHTYKDSKASERREHLRRKHIKELEDGLEQLKLTQSKTLSNGKLNFPKLPPKQVRQISSSVPTSLSILKKPSAEQRRDFMANAVYQN